MSREPNKGLFADVLRVGLLVAVFTAMAVVFRRQDLGKLLFDIDTIRTELSGGGNFSGRALSGLIFTLAGGGLTVFFLPRLWVSAVGGIIYGAFTGTILSLLATLFGASVLHVAGKYLLAEVVERRMGDKVNTWKVRFQENAFWWVLYGRLFPFSNSTAMSLICGSCKVPFLPFLWGSLLGYVPLTVVFATYGSGGAKGNIWQIGLATLLLVCSITLRSFLKRWFPTGEGRKGSLCRKDSPDP
jgi:uncharacterized membrane protein YdjX (TVP38/TMEM64 family)